MKIILIALTVFTSQAHAKSLTITIQDLYSEMYLTTGVFVPNPSQQFNINLNSDGSGQLIMPTRNYHSGISAEISSQATVGQSVTVYADQALCQIKLKITMDIVYCNIKKMEAGKDCFTSENISKETNLLCSDIIDHKIKFAAGYELYEEPYRYAFNSELQVGNLQFNEN